MIVPVAPKVLESFQGHLWFILWKILLVCSDSVNIKTYEEIGR